MNGLTLRLREIASALPTNDDAGTIAPMAMDDTWHDSTAALERGLEVVELPPLTDAAPKENLRA